MVTQRKYEGAEVICEYKSANIRRSRYDTQKKKLVIEFNNGIKYAAEEVPLPVYIAFERAESQGKYFAKEIKPKYQFHKADDAPQAASGAAA